MMRTENGGHTSRCEASSQAETAYMEPFILIAEEQPAISELLCWMLHLAGYRVMVCITREAALTWREQAIAPGGLPVVLLMDLSPLCVSEAADFLRCVRAQWQAVYPVLPGIVVLTTHPQVQAELGIRERVLLKPFHVHDLLALIRQATVVASEDVPGAFLSNGE